MKILDSIRVKKIDKFKTYIDNMKKHNILDSEDGDIYKDLDTLRKLRNRIHVQNEKNHFAKDERNVFTYGNKEL